MNFYFQTRLVASLSTNKPKKSGNQILINISSQKQDFQHRFMAVQIYEIE